MFHRLIRTHDAVVPTILRLVLGIIFFAHGAQKMLGWFGGAGFSGTMGFFVNQMHIPTVFALGAICAEFLGGIGLIIGLLGRVAAAAITVNMLVAIFRVHLPNGFFMNWSGTQKGEGIEYHLLAIAVAIAIMVLGCGAMSFDLLLSRKTARAS